MKNVWNLILLIACAVVTLSCSKDDVEIDEVWKAKNESKILEISLNDDYKKIPDPSSQFSVYYKPIKTGTGERVLMTDHVKVLYKGWMINDKVFDKSPGFDTPETDDDEPAEFSIMREGYATYAVIAGWGIALQNMRVGDRWEVWIPWQLAYGVNGKSSSTMTSIPGCSALAFEMEVIDITKRGQ